MQPKYPIFIPSKGRWESRLTMKALDRMGVSYTVVVEPQERDQYVKAIGADRLLVTPHRDKGLTVTRNWIWDYARDLGAPRFWTMDDNLQQFYRLNNNTKIKIQTGSFLCAMEDFTDRYINVPVSGMHYEQFIQRRVRQPPFMLNRRVYSNMLIQTDFRDPRGKPYRNECFYNDDTDLCLRILKDGNCTILFNAFLVWKSLTMMIKGGNTPVYQGDGRWKMAEELRRKHPDVTKIVRKWGRWQHQVDYRPFRNNRLIRRPDIEIPEGVDNYGMTLEQAPALAEVG